MYFGSPIICGISYNITITKDGRRNARHYGLVVLYVVMIKEIFLELW
jgi:hypothetical protein